MHKWEENHFNNYWRIQKQLCKNIIRKEAVPEAKLLFGVMSVGLKPSFFQIET